MKKVLIDGITRLWLWVSNTILRIFVEPKYLVTRVLGLIPCFPAGRSAEIRSSLLWRGVMSLRGRFLGSVPPYIVGAQVCGRLFFGNKTSDSVAIQGEQQCGSISARSRNRKEMIL